ncbi:MAG: endolytic transglycosylase MltG [Bacteroidia bacterium]
MAGGIKRRISSFLLVVLLVFGTGSYIFYRFFYYHSVHLEDKSKLIYVHTGWDFEKVLNMLEEKKIITHPRAFTLVAGLKGYKDHIIPGRYRAVNGMSNLQLVNLLASGKQEPVTINLYNIRTKYDLAGILANKIEEDSTEVVNYLNDPKYVKKFGFNTASIIAMFIPGTYQLLWTDSPDKFISRMHDNYEAFWTGERRKEAVETGLSYIQVSILASIVQAEQSLYNDEKKVIAGLYINRLHKDMPLQSDPTLVFARGDFSILRVREGDKKVESPYNTYIHTGLPPGPINMPDASSIDAVLNYDKNDYLYMCAEADFSGRHHFSKSLKEQNEYADKYRKALDARQIIR